MSVRKAAVGVLLGLLVTTVDAQVARIKTIAGTGVAGFTNDGGPATSAAIDTPSAIAVDGAGNVYIAVNNRIRKISPNGIVTTAAGTGTAAYGGDGGPATLAEFNEIGDLAVDSAGNLYVADTSNQAIRKISASTGLISTVAGTGSLGNSGAPIGDGEAATSATLRRPGGVAVDSGGNIYIADTYEQRVRKVSASTGIITTIAGNGDPGTSGDGGQALSAKLGYPGRLTVDSSGNVFVATEQRVRKITPGGIITTVAGTGSSGYSGDGGPATQADLGQATLGGEFGIATDTAGNIYIADYSNNRIRKVAVSDGIISTITGRGTRGFSGDGDSGLLAQLYEPNDVGLDSAGDLYIADTRNNRIRKVTNDVQAPSAPTGLVATVVSANQVNLAWAASTDNRAVSAYKIYRRGGLIGTLGNVTNYSDASLSASTNYTYTVVACDAEGNCSLQSQAASVFTPADNLSPTAPANLIAIAMSSSRVDLTWTASTDNVAVSTYKVYRGGTLLAAFGPITHYSDFGLTASTSYSYAVVACDATNNCSASSTAASVVTLQSGATSTGQNRAPSMPTGLAATAISSSQVDLTWNAPTDAVSAYKIYRGGALLSSFEPVTRYSDFGLTAGTSYSYTVAACDALNNCSAASIAAPVVTPQSGLTNTDQRSDCLFNWTEATSASILAPRGAASQRLGPYYYRYYSQTNAYLGVSSDDNHFYYLGPASASTLLDLGAVSTWYATAGCG